MGIRTQNNEKFMNNILNGISYDTGKQFEFNFNRYNFLINYYLVDGNSIKRPWE